MFCLLYNQIKPRQHNQSVYCGHYLAEAKVKISQVTFLFLFMSVTWFSGFSNGDSIYSTISLCYKIIQVLALSYRFLYWLELEFGQFSDWLLKIYENKNAHMQLDVTLILIIHFQIGYAERLWTSIIHEMFKSYALKL